MSRAKMINEQQTSSADENVIENSEESQDSEDELQTYSHPIMKKSLNKVNFHKQQNSKRHKNRGCQQDAIDEEDHTIWASSSLPKCRTRSQTAPPSNKPVHRRYRKMKLRSHDDMLQEQYEELRVLLNDSKNCSRDQLREDHVQQTKQLIEDYRAMNRGARARGILISQSLPQCVRLKSPRSVCSSCNNSPRRLRSSSLESTKRVSFKTKEYEPHPPQSTISIEGELQYRLESHEQTQTQSKYNYIQHITSQPNKIKRAKRLKNRIKTEDNTEDTVNTPRNPGIIEDISGIKHSDSNLKHTHNPHIKHWLKDKEKLIQAEKKQKRLQKQKELEDHEKEQQEKENKRLESQKKFQEWQKKKRKQILLQRRQRLRKQKLEQETLNRSKSETNLADDNRPKSAKHPPKQPSTTKAKVAPEKVDETKTQKQKDPQLRPKSAPAQRNNSKPRPIPVSVLLDKCPELKQKLKNLERQKQLKHRQSYEEWCKIKEKEKRGTLKMLREQRQKLEKEISEETERVISEAARRRIDGLRYKGARSQQEENKSKERETVKSATKPSPYTWKESESDRNKTKESAESTRPNRTTPVPKKENKTEVEDKIPDQQTNPFKDPFKLTKARKPKSNLEQNGINGPHFSEFIWNLVNETENGSRPEPQGEDSSSQKKARNGQADNKATPNSERKSPRSQHNSRNRISTANRQAEGKESSEPIIESGGGIFSMTSIE